VAERTGARGLPVKVGGLSGCPICDVGATVECRTYDDGARIVRCLACGWHDLTARPGTDD
jgi:Zn ribbon nucleic-acid-binding protein